MSFLNHLELNTPFLSSDLLNCPHCFSTRQGGVSEGIYESLNLGANRGDFPAAVLENYHRLGAEVGFKTENLVFTQQIHEDSIRLVTSENRGEGLYRPVIMSCDGLITQDKDVALTIFTADCTPVLLYDPISQSIGAVHAGWRGTALGIVEKAVEAMISNFDCDPANITAAIGPCISRCCFETTDDVPCAMLDALGDDAKAFIMPVKQKFMVDLKGLNALWLHRAGVHNIDITQDCTCCDPQRFWTHRKTGNQRGSLASIIQLP